LWPVARIQDPQLGIDSFGHSGLNIVVRFWLATEKYHHTRFKVNNRIFEALQLAGVKIPLPQSEVRSLNKEPNKEME